MTLFKKNTHPHDAHMSLLALAEIGGFQPLSVIESQEQDTGTGNPTSLPKTSSRTSAQRISSSFPFETTPQKWVSSWSWYPFLSGFEGKPKGPHHFEGVPQKRHTNSSRTLSVSLQAPFASPQSALFWALAPTNSTHDADRKAVFFRNPLLDIS